MNLSECYYCRCNQVDKLIRAKNNGTLFSDKELGLLKEDMNKKTVCKLHKVQAKLSKDLDYTYFQNGFNQVQLDGYYTRKDLSKISRHLKNVEQQPE